MIPFLLSCLHWLALFLAVASAHYLLLLLGYALRQIHRQQKIQVKVGLALVGYAALTYLVTMLIWWIG